MSAHPKGQSPKGTWNLGIHDVVAVARSMGATVLEDGTKFTFRDARVVPAQLIVQAGHRGPAPSVIHRWIRKLSHASGVDRSPAVASLTSLYAARDAASEDQKQEAARKAAETERARRLAEEAQRRGAEQAAREEEKRQSEEINREKRRLAALLFKEQERLGLSDRDAATLCGTGERAWSIWRHAPDPVIGTSEQRIREWIDTFRKMEPDKPKSATVASAAAENHRAGASGEAAPLFDGAGAAAAPPSPSDVVPSVLDGVLTIRTTVPVVYKAEAPVFLRLDLRKMEASELLALSTQVQKEILRRAGAGS